ncbi:MAG: sugar phosphate isomerase/epimerase [Planctomycetaceae bacterium]|nr:sugar phosphate isomerase/epimerase [Planctomycetaceae bacterium]
MRISFSTLACPEWNWQEVLQHGVQYGYDGVEVRLLKGELDLLAAPELRPHELPLRRREMEDSGFVICGLSSSVRFDEPTAAQRTARLETGYRYLDLAHELRTSFVRVFGDVLPQGANAAVEDATIDQIADGLNRLGERGAAAGVDVLIETHGDFADSARMQRLVRHVVSPAVGLLWDTHHPWRFYGESLATTFERLRPWTRHTHWKDSVTRLVPRDTGHSTEAATQAHALMSGHRPADYVLFGGGEFPAHEAFRLLQDAGYAGWYSLEWEKAWHPEIEPPEVALPLFPRKMQTLATLCKGHS